MTALTALRTLPGRRKRLDAISPKLHCSIIGTCLTLSDLRKLSAKAKFGLGPGTSDYRLHGAVVQSCTDSGFAKVVTRLLDKRFAAAIARFTKAADEEALAALWDTALASGDIPGAYWALVSHPLEASALRERAYGEVHMLSHLSGASQRAELRRQTGLERDRDHLRQQLDAARETAERLRGRVSELEHGLKTAAIHEKRAEALERRVAELESGAVVADLRAELQAMREDRDALALRTESLAGRLRAREEEAVLHRQEAAHLMQRLTDMELRLREAQGGRAAEVDDYLDLAQKTILYVGGAARTAAHLEQIVTRANGQFAYHDGGLEDGCPRLAGAVSRADVVLCPVTCVSHEAVGHLKRNCRKACKRFVPLPGHSVSAFMRGLRVIDAPPSTVQEAAE